MSRDRFLQVIWPVVPVLGALAVVALLLVLVGISPGQVVSSYWEGSFGQTNRTLSTLAFWIPLLLCATGLLMTFTAGLWNIGVEGQMIMGAIGASFIALQVGAVFEGIPGWILIILEIVTAMGLGAFWAAIAAVLKTRGGVHEIFGGVALNFLAIIATNFLISGPWQPPEGGSFRGTVPFPRRALLPIISDSPFSPLSLILALAALALVWWALKGTSWGLKLRAMGRNPLSAFLLGVSSEREAITSMMLCGALAGLGGAIRVLSWFDSLRQSISGGIGFLAILIVLLAALRPLWTLIISLLFSALLTGGTKVQLTTQLHSSLSGIVQGLLVLFMLLFGDFGTFFKDKSPPSLEEQEA